ncbi:hypothetical protein B0H12DRAFT_1011763, partial [Mycena haematopus]
ADASAQSSLTLLSSMIATGFESSQDTPRLGQSASLTSSNNFINFCATTTALPLTNGTQTTSGFCNPAPMGVLPASTRMPTSKFTYPRNGDTIAANAPMTIGLAVTNLATGNFANDDTNYLAAPQQLDSSGQIQGHPFIVIEQVPSGPTVSNPALFTFFKGMTGVADSTGVLTTAVSNGLPVGSYRLSSIIAATNGQPVLMPVLQHGAVDDAIYVRVWAWMQSLFLISFSQFFVANGAAQPTNQTALPVSPPSTSVSISVVLAGSKS